VHTNTANRAARGFRCGILRQAAGASDSGRNRAIGPDAELLLARLQQGRLAAGLEELLERRAEVGHRVHPDKECPGAPTFSAKCG
jgi:hypothetical protein